MTGPRTDRRPDVPADLAWQEDAACRGVSTPDIFFPTAMVPHRARQFCAGCTVRSECLDFAMAVEGDTVTVFHRHGFWGGTTPDERADMVRQQRETA